MRQMKHYSILVIRLARSSNYEIGHLADLSSAPRCMTGCPRRERRVTLSH
jgi:hypothetical protein